MDREACWATVHGVAKSRTQLSEFTYLLNAEDSGLIPGWRRSPGERNGNPLQGSCLEKPMDREACWATVYRSKNQTRLSN